METCTATIRAAHHAACVHRLRRHRSLLWRPVLSTPTSSLLVTAAALVRALAWPRRVVVCFRIVSCTFYPLSTSWTGAAIVHLSTHVYKPNKDHSEFLIESNASVGLGQFICQLFASSFTYPRPLRLLASCARRCTAALLPSRGSLRLPRLCRIGPRLRSGPTTMKRLPHPRFWKKSPVTCMRTVTTVRKGGCMALARMNPGR